MERGSGFAYTRMTDPCGEKEAQVERDSLKGVLVSALDAVEGFFLVRVHSWVLDVVLLPGGPNLERQPHVQHESPNGGQDDVAMIFHQKIRRRHLGFLEVPKMMTAQESLSSTV